MDSIIEQAPKHVAWHEPLVRRPKLTAKAITALASFVASALVEELRQREDVDSITAEAIAEAVRTRIDGGEQDLVTLYPGAAKKAKEDAWEEVNVAWQAGNLTDEYFVEASLSGKNDLVSAGLALLGDIPEPAAEKMLNSQSTRAVMAVCWRAGLTASTCYEIQITLARISPNAAQQPEGVATIRRAKATLPGNWNCLRRSRRAKAFANELPDERAGPMLGEDLQKTDVLDPPIEDDGRLDAVAHSLGAGLHLEDHATGNRSVFPQSVDIIDIEVWDQVLVLVEDALNICQHQ